MKYFILFVLISFVANHSLRAQDNYIMIGDTMITGRNLVQPEGIRKYHEITLRLKRNVTIYTADNVSEFCIDKQTFISMPSPVDGEEENVFLLRLAKSDSIAVYQYENQTGRHLFFCESNGRLEEISEQNNLYADYLINKHRINKNHPINRYQIKATPQSISFADKLDRTGNPNLLTRFRFGLWAGMGQSTLSEDIMPENNTDTHLFVGAFFNIPLYKQFSIQPELFYMQESCVINKADVKLSDKVYNRKSIVAPLILRYSFNEIRGPLIPFIQAGPSMHYVLEEKTETRMYFVEDNLLETYLVETDGKNYFYPGIQAGLGSECRLTKNHSLFFDVRCMYLAGKDSSMLLYTTLSANF